jgi:hypothetical protein
MKTRRSSHKTYSQRHSQRLSKRQSLQKSLQKSLRKTQRRSLRQSSRSKQPSQKLSSRSIRTKYPTLEDVLTFFFNAGAHEIRKKEPSYVAPTAAEFLHEVKSTLKSTKFHGGSNEDNLELFMTKLVGASVGTFDTSCNTMLAYFAIVVWASFFYTLAVSYFQFPESMLVSAFANPVYAFLDILQGRIGSGAGPFQRMKNRVRTFVEFMLPNIPPMVGTGIQQSILFIINSQGYVHLVERGLACLLLALGDQTCSARCGEVRL